jgi:hypothetical protein
MDITSQLAGYKKLRVGITLSVRTAFAILYSDATGK